MNEIKYRLGPVVLLAIPFLAAGQEPASMKIPAPELRDVSAWINSDPVKLADWKGQVVVVHFFTHGCINCIHNYPHMKAWQEKYAGKGVMILGIHTPEVAAEKDLDRIRKKIKENELKFAVAVDNDARNWQAWGNRWWPSVYLIDKRGNVRYRWDGELNYKEVRGEEIMRKKIEELIAEK